MAKFTLDIEEEIDFNFIAIASHAKMYKLCWALNAYLGFEFVKHDDFIIKESFSNFRHFSSYKFHQTNTEIFYQLIENNGQLVSHKNRELPPIDEGASILIKEYKNFNYFLYINGKFIDSDYELLLKELRNVPRILTTFEINLQQIKNRSIFLDYDPFKQNKNSSHARPSIR
ncbi:MAG: IPExxxVDY family protein [Bacteroidia bacterium]|nr:IPExxxVDY family protein [Bacteroidia bacterium]